MTPLIEIKNLKKSYKDFSLKDVSFNMEKGCIMGLIGPNGAGKSTIIKLILNLIKKEYGDIKIFGLDNIKHQLEIKDKVGFVFAEDYLYDELSIAEMKRIIAPLYRNWDNTAFKGYMSKFVLPANKKIKNLSKGMKMKLSLALALSHNADLLIMDEPTSGLDPVIRNELLQILTDIIQDENKGVFFSTHITSDLDKIADYITLINDGEIIFSKAKDELLDSHGLIKGDKKLLDDDMKKLFVGVNENQFGFEGLIKNRKQAKTLVENGAVLEKPVLEDIMLHYTGGCGNV